METKTDIEILRQHIPAPKNEGEKNDDINILQSMNDFAMQEKQKEAIEFTEWIKEHCFLDKNSNWLRDGEKTSAELYKLFQDWKLKNKEK